jgi:uncharacterized protein YqjF (DUF2071 family)
MRSTRCGSALAHASARLRDDKALVLAAIRSSGDADGSGSACLRLASDRLRSDPLVAAAALRQHGNALADVAPSLQVWLIGCKEFFFGGSKYLT